MHNFRLIWALFFVVSLQIPFGMAAEKLSPEQVVKIFYTKHGRMQEPPGLSAEEENDVMNKYIDAERLRINNEEYIKHEGDVVEYYYKFQDYCPEWLKYIEVSPAVISGVHAKTTLTLGIKGHDTKYSISLNNKSGDWKIDSVELIGTVNGNCH
ncbi:DUF3828 domain-containing protein [Salmonella enterica subsp. enterica]|nr:DUF3828 domain-containing protein [Salmonella enterica subsp. enterica serovar Hessarek]